MIKGIIFDLDGTLIDSMTVWDNVGRNLLLSYGITPPSDLDDRLKVMSFTQSSRYFIDEFHLPMTVEQVMTYLYGVVEERYRNTIPEKKNAKALLQRLKQEGILACVATATDPKLAKAALRRLGMLSDLAFVLTCDELGTGKDTPKIYHYATQKMNLLKENMVVVEDALHCVLTAKSAGYRVIGVYDASASEDEEQMKRYCDWYTTGFDPLEEFLGQMEKRF